MLSKFGDAPHSDTSQLLNSIDQAQSAPVASALESSAYATCFSANSNGLELLRSLSYVKSLLNIQPIPNASPSEYRGMYRSLLIFLHHVIRASVPLMRAAKERCVMLGGPLYSPLVDYFCMHSLEEENHDEWLIEDLKRIGTSDFSFSGPSYEVASAVGAQYYWIHHHDPIVFSGYVAALESFPPSRTALEAFAERCQLPLSCFETLMHHAYYDDSHSSDLYRLIDGLDIVDSQLQQMIHNGSRTLIELHRVKAGTLTKKAANAPDAY